MLTKQVLGDLSATPEYQAVVRAGLASTVIESCASSYACQLGDPRLADEPQNEVYWSLPANAYQLEFFVHCGGAPAGGCANAGSERVIAGFHRFEIDAVDADSPSLVDGSLLGTLLERSEQRGVRSLRLKAFDYGSGLREVVVTIDDSVVARVTPDLNGGKCADAGLSEGPDYRSFRPCPTTIEVAEFSINSAAYSDGPHKLHVDVFDAAGNATRAVEQEVRFENVPPPASLTKPVLRVPASPTRPADDLRAEPGSWRGDDIKFAYQWQRSLDGIVWGDIPRATGGVYVVTRDDIGKRLRVVVTASNIQGSSSATSDPTGVVESGVAATPSGDAPMTSDDAPGGGNPSTAQLVIDREQRTVEVKHSAQIVITGRLVDAEGQPLANAQVDVFEQLVLTAAPWLRIGTVTTDSQGGYAFRPTTTASRRLRFAFADQRDSANYRSMREVLVSVRAGMSISAKRRVLSPGDVIRLRGRVTIDQLPKTGTWVEIQVLDGGVWRTVATRKTSSKGLWTFNHRLRQSSGVMFRFRSRLRVVGDVASAESKSTQVKVRIR
ncbi:MAG: carboxypeptidase regulatory-like domain-containing protein [Solirubrobacteraceae bacterium]|nr:carboxypeptidase regulatory-like domain-containing protein [Solirubrobacteraceae bacterium]